jgi:predicted AAA+ superfamily ATPase
VATASDGYLPRVIDVQLLDKLKSSGAVLILGPKWCGKTRTAEVHSSSQLYLQDPAARDYLLEMASLRPSYLLEGATPRLIDEWQVAPRLWDAVIFEINQRKKRGQFILTGSSVPINEDVMHTGTGRIARLVMRTMSLHESKESSSEVSLQALFSGDVEIGGASNLTVEDIASIIVRGGWPEAVVDNSTRTGEMAINYLDAIIESDISRVDDVRRNPDHAQALLRSLARSSAQSVTLATIRGDIQADGFEISTPTMTSYINALRRLYVVGDIKAWAPEMRSRTALRSSPTWHLCDPSLAAAALDADEERLMNDLKTFGFLFETLCVRDLCVYASSLGGKAFHYRDKNGLETDIIIQLRDGRWAAIEVKLGSRQIDEACDNLNALHNKVVEKTARGLAFKMIVTAGQYAYRRTDGIYVVPLACLGP